MTCQHNRKALVPIQFFYEVHHVTFHWDIDTYGRLIEKEYFRTVEQGKSHVGPHPLAEAQFSGEAVEIVVKAQRLLNEAQRLLEGDFRSMSHTTRFHSKLAATG